jgi:hypothetical protein
MMLIENPALMDIVEEHPKNTAVVRTNVNEGFNRRYTCPLEPRVVAHNLVKVIA